MHRHLLTALALCSLVPTFAAEMGMDEKGDPAKTEQHKAHPLTAAELKKLIDDKKVVLIDCNGTAAYAKGHIPGAIDFEASKGKLADLLPADKKALVVAYCGGPKCKAYKDGAAAAKQLGYTHVRHFAGGLSGWKDAGYSLEK